jgi:hypothetical protein
MPMPSLRTCIIGASAFTAGYLAYNWSIYPPEAFSSIQPYPEAWRIAAEGVTGAVAGVITSATALSLISTVVKASRGVIIGGVCAAGVVALLYGFDCDFGLVDKVRNSFLPRMEGLLKKTPGQETEACAFPIQKTPCTVTTKKGVLGFVEKTDGTHDAGNSTPISPNTSLVIKGLSAKEPDYIITTRANVDLMIRESDLTQPHP